MRVVLLAPSTEARLLRYGVLLLFFVLLQAVVAFSDEKKEVQIFEVRKNLQMSSKDPIIRDYYVNAGENQGVKPGAYIPVFRKVPLADPYKQDTQAHVEIPVGIMKVIYSDRTMAIGRIHSIRSMDNSPVLDSVNFMVGDRLDLGGISFEKQAKSSDKNIERTSEKAAEKVEKADSQVDEKPSKPEGERKAASAQPPKPQEPVDVISR